MSIDRVVGRVHRGALQGRRRVGCAAALWACVALVAGCEVAQQLEPVVGPANVVVLMSDDLGYADLGVQGARLIPTPYIDALAAQGVRFTQAYATAASCSPSRAALLTGRYPQRFGFEFNTGSAAISHAEDRGLEPSTSTLAELLGDAGYATGLVGKWHLGTRDRYHPLEHGFDAFFGFLPGGHSYYPDASAVAQPWERLMEGRSPVVETEYLTTAFAREAVSFIEQHRDEPFFLFVAFNAVHPPHDDPPVEYLKRFPNAPAPSIRRYRAMVSALDDAVGRILGALDDTGLRGRTLVVFTNDNGGANPEGSNAPLRGSKLYLFEGGVRVPMIVRWPGAPGETATYDAPVSLLDVLPTALAAAGVDVPAELDGVDLAPFVLGEAEGDPHDTLLWRNGPNLAVRRGRWKLVQAGDHPWLFDLETDVGETVNLAADRPDVVEELQRAFDDWAADLDEPAWPGSPVRSAPLVDGVEYELHL